jgi:outer membrane protein
MSTIRDLPRMRRAVSALILTALTGAACVATGMPLRAQQPGPPPDTTRNGLTRAMPLPLTPAKASAMSTSPPAILTLDTAVAIALVVGTPVQQARFASADARTEMTRTYGGILPSVDAGGMRTVTNGDPLVGSRAYIPWNTQFETMGYQLQTSLNLLGALSSYPGIRSADYTRQTYDLSLERTRQSVTLDVSQAFLQTVLDSELVVIAAQNYAVSQEQVVQLESLVRVGKRPPADMYEAQAQASANQSVYLDAVNRQRIDEIALLQRVHIDPQRTVAIATPVLDTTLLNGEYLDTTAMADAALHRRPDLQSAQAAIDATRWGIRRANAENMPSLSVGFTLFSTGRVFDYANQDGVPQITTPQTPLTTQVGYQATRVFSIGVGYSLSDLFKSSLDRQEAQVAYDLASVSEGDVRRSVTGDIARAIGEYGVAVQRMASTASGLTAAQAAFQLVTGRYNVGFATIVDLLTAQAALAQAQSLRAQAVVQLSLAKRAVAYAMGFQPTDRLP